MTDDFFQEARETCIVICAEIRARIKALEATIRMLKRMEKIAQRQLAKARKTHKRRAG